ncbi:MAG: hypothetical protein FJY95_07875 [Candidatus Handelsmanbacteria bacterium]|nr:hypothetical protein [Candidatus Handelsmanbacteria bacterium]
MDIQRVQTRLPAPQAAAPSLNRAGAETARGAQVARHLPRISAPQVTSDPKLQSALSSEETQALEQLFSAFRTAVSPGAAYTDRGTAPYLPPLGGSRPGQMIDVVA